MAKGSFLPFAVWRNVILNLFNNNIQATISVFRLVKNMSINAKSVVFRQCHAKPHSICLFVCLFFYHNIKDNERNLCQDLLTITIENANLDLKVHALHYANKLLTRVRLFFQKLLQTHSTWSNNTKKVFKSTDHVKPYFYSYVFMGFFYHNINVKENVFFFRARAKKGIARHIDTSSVVWTLVILIGLFWACACKLSWTLFSHARVQRGGKKESSGTGLRLTTSDHE